MPGVGNCLERCCRNRCVQCFVLGIRWIPVLFILAVVGWSYYAYVYELCIKSVPSAAEMVFYLLFYHLFLVVFLLSYYRCAFAPLGLVPKQFTVPEEISRQMEYASQVQRRQLLESFSKELPVLTRTYDGALRYCDKCKCIKPDRSHHCSICGQCVLKMDHHCPWVNTCVSFSNYKFFLLFLGYALLYCLYVALTDLRYFIDFWTNTGIQRDSFGKFHIMFLFFVSSMFAISVSVLFFYHLWLVAKNRSTLESFRPPIFVSGPDKNGFSLGVRGNFQEIFGNQRILWFLPFSSSLGNGVVFPIRTYDMECNSLLGGGGGSAENRWSVDSDSEGGQSDFELARVPNGYTSNAHHHAVIVR